jgi:RNA polymerase sigma factor (sigma-70 family)
MGVMSSEQRFEAMWRDHAAALFGYAFRRTASVDDAWDVVAEVYLTAWRRVDDVPDLTERPWLFVTARNVMANQSRGHRRQSELAAQIAAHVIVTDPTEPSSDTSMVNEALSRLSTSDRELVQLVTWDGLTPAEAAVVLKIPPARVRVRLHRARARLRGHLLDLGIRTEDEHWPVPQLSATCNVEVI